MYIKEYKGNTKGIKGKGNIYYNSGNVGIGTNNPIQALHIHNNTTSADVRIIISDNTSTSSISRGFQILKGSANDAYLFNYENTPMIFGTNSAERMRITSTGNVGIGTNAPGTKLHVNGDINIGNYFDTSGSRYFGFNAVSGMEIESTTLGGNYSQKVHLITHYFGNGYGRRLSIQENGNVVIGGNVNVGSLTNPSDSRIKKDIEDINDESALNKLLLIQPTTYNYIDVERNKGFGKVYGFIAQQIREVIPEAVPIIEAIIPNIYKNCLINNKREVYHNIPLDTPIDTEVKIKGSEYKIKEVYEDYFVIDKDIEDVEAFVYGYNINDFHTLDKTYIFTLNVCATQELHRRIEAQSVLLKSQDDRIKDLETKVAMLLSNTT